MRNFMNRVFIGASNRFTDVRTRVVKVLNDNSGEGFVDTAVKILISVVIGALVLAGLYMLFKDTVLPELSRRITEMFNFKG
ncbi:MAG: DUF6133 family protein [Caldicoprobacteraceae bacterium]